MHRLATVHARDNQPTNDVTTQPISVSASFTEARKVRRLKTLMVCLLEDQFSRFDRTPMCDRRTDILRRHSPLHAMHGIAR